MTLAVWQASIANANGDVQPTASVTVQRSIDGTLADIYSDLEGTVPMDNPFTVDANGFARFYAVEDRYDITATLSPFAARVFADVALVPASDGNVYATAGTATPGSGSFNDYVLQPFVAVVRIEADAAGTTITGFAADGNDGRVVTIVNVGTGPLTLPHGSTSSLAGNRLALPGSADMIIPPNDALSIWQDVVGGVWRKLS